MPFESYNPRKESREIARDQRKNAQENAENSGIRLGFARSHTETAKPMDTLKGMLKRAYKEGKLYSEKQAGEAANKVAQALEAAGAKMRLNPGDRITFRNDSIVLSAFDRKTARFADVKISLEEGEGSPMYKRREIVNASREDRAVIAKKVEEEKDKPEVKPETMRQTLSAQRREALRAFIKDGQGLRRAIRNTSEEENESKLQIYSSSRPFSAIPSQFKDYECSEIIATREKIQKNYMIGLKPLTGEVVVFDVKYPDKVMKPKIKDFTDLGQLKLALALLANPSEIDLKPTPPEEKK